MTLYYKYLKVPHHFIMSVKNQGFESRCNETVTLLQANVEVYYLECY